MPVQIDKGKALESMNLTSLIDVVFLLLIFFLVSTRFSEEEFELDTNLPSASEAQPLMVKPKELIVNVTEKGQYFVSGKVLDESALELAIRRSTGGKVIIRADKNSRTGNITAVINLCKKANIRDYSLATTK